MEHSGEHPTGEFPARRPGRRSNDFINPKNMIAWLSLTAMLGGMIATGLTWFGARFSGPGKEISEVNEKITQVLQTQGNQENRVAKIEDNMALWTYLICVQIRKTDPDLMPRNCSEVIQ